MRSGRARFLFGLVLVSFCASVAQAQLTITGTGVGSSDNYTIWVAGTGFASDSYVDARVAPNGTSIVGSYRGSARTLTTKNGVSVITFRVTDPTQQAYLNSNGLNLWVVNPSVPVWTGPGLAKRSGAGTTQLTISGGGVGDSDQLSAYVVGSAFASNSYIDARAGGSGPILQSYREMSRSLNTANGMDIITFRVSDSVQESILSRGGLYLWVVNPSTATSAPVWRGPQVVKRSNKEQAFGGANYNWYHVDFTGSTCRREPYGNIVNYNQTTVRNTVKSQLATMYAGGQRRLRVAIFVSDNFSSGTVVQAVSGTFPAQYLTNLQNYLSDIKAGGYQEVMVGLFPLGNYSFWTSTSYSPTIASQYWGLLQQLHQVVASSGLPYVIDLGNELMPPSSGSTVWKTYVTNIWGWYVAAYGPNYTVGFSTPSPERISNMAVYGSTKPSVVDIHIYTNPATGYTTADSALSSQGLSNIDIIIGESWYNDSTYAQGIRGSINASNSGRWMRWLTEWPRSQTGSQDPSCTGQNVQSPLDDSVYLLNGF